MPESRELRSVVDAAEQAAAAGDYASAEQFLRQAALLQEASLGPLHPDLANTLNNLGVVCEITKKPGDAEHCFRRACAIATAVLEPDHPFVATSRKNLEDFCAARGKAPERSSYEASPPVASRKWSNPLAIGALIAGGVFVSFFATATWLRSNDAPIPTEATKETATNRPDTAPPPPLPRPPAENRAIAASKPQRPLVANANLCRDLSSDWLCVPPSVPVGSGSLFFYTRLKSPTDTTVQHRWYRGDRLRQVVELPIRANTTAGYRTYSRNTINNDNQSAGPWRVELRTRDGVLLHEERFVVR